MSEWEKIDISTHITSDMTSLHVNIPHFVYMYTEDELYKTDNCGDIYSKNFNDLYDKIESGLIDEKYLMEQNRVMPFVFTVREIAKIKRTFNNGETIEYLRFFPYKGKYIVTNDGIPICWEEFAQLKIK